jgi:hypothetical protein
MEVLQFAWGLLTVDLHGREYWLTIVGVLMQLLVIEAQSCFRLEYYT